MPLVMVLACVFVTAAVTIVHMAVPELDSSDARLLWLATLAP